MSKKVIISIQHGMAYLIKKPKDIRVEIRDYDIEGEGLPEERDDCFQDEDGDWYQAMEL